MLGLKLCATYCTWPFQRAISKINTDEHSCLKKNRKNIHIKEEEIRGSVAVFSLNMTVDTELLTQS